MIPLKICSSSLQPKTQKKAVKGTPLNSLLQCKNNFPQRRWFAQAAVASSEIFLAPSVRYLLVKNSLQVDELKGIGTGVRGRILKGDVLNYLANRKATPIPTQQPVVNMEVSTGPKPPVINVSRESGPRFSDIPNSNMRRIIAKRLTESKQTTPHSYVTQEVVMDNVLALRAKLNAQSTVKISVNDFIIKAAAMSLAMVPEMNAYWNPATEEPTPNSNIDVSLAVATEKGLITPVIRDAARKSVKSIAETAQALVAKAREGKLKPEEFQGGTFSISNLGMYEIGEFVAVINPPQAGILAIGKTTKAVIPLMKSGAEDSIGTLDSITIQNRMKVTLSVDPRVAQEVAVTQFLESFAKFMENPSSLV